MFTGIVHCTGVIEASTRKASGRALTLRADKLATALQVGDSLAVNGVCLTVTRLKQSLVDFDVSNETLDKCLISEWRVATEVNLETALTLHTPLGGHLVCGHVDGCARLCERTDTADFTEMRFSVPRSLGGCIAPKGSVALDGVSLTSNQVQDKPTHTEFTVMLVPHTLQTTTLGRLQPPCQLHLEIDMLARYVHRRMQFEQFRFEPGQAAKR